MKSREEIDQLKESWKFDPIWDIEKTEGFEDHEEELKAFSDEMKSKWKKITAKRLKNNAEKMGLENNLLAAAYIMTLERKIEMLIERVDTIESIQNMRGNGF